MIYLWDIPDLVKDLRSNTIPEWQVGWYLFLSPVLSILNGMFFGVLLFGHHIVEYSFQGWLKKPHPSIAFYNYWGASFGMLTVFVAFFGIYLCYRKNKKGDNKDFVSRMACLSFPVNIHITIYAIALLAIAGSVAYFFFQGKISAFQDQLSGAPVIATPFLMGRVNKFAKNLRAMILMGYPILALIPAVLSFIHYAILRDLIQQVAQQPQESEGPDSHIDR